ncbi:uncharacterized protein LOC129907726 [Episyrphus balteatus]|uniref:uncharacterized protein LOC129907726 n=1 Tax=Episyrphus balteatus TaxID=286459 RepID=UPI0024857774|nr:uncharacterized protein LOC129907726 [Episyrphus balteatus]
MTKRIDIFNIWYSAKKVGSAAKANETWTVFKQTHKIEDLQAKKKILNLCKCFQRRWEACSKKKNVLLSKNSAWLDVEEDFSAVQEQQDENISQKPHGRPKKPFLESSSRTKRRRIAEIVDIVDEDIACALKKCQSKENIQIKQLDTNDALKLLVEAKLSKHQYQVIRNLVNQKTEVDVFPSYVKVLKAKQDCYPELQTIKITDSLAEVSLQGLLNHTAERIVESQQEIFENLENDFGHLTLIGKWGFDGSSGQSEYKQRISGEFSDSDMFITSYVPIQLYSQMGSEKKIVWHNPRPGSTRYCRPIRFQLKKETADLSRTEQEYIQTQINELNETVIKISDRFIRVKHILKLTMVDGKVCNALSHTASQQVCYICGAKPSNMNDIESSLERTINEDFLDFGISPLHAWIRFFEFFIHLAYRLDFKKWRTGSVEKPLMDAQKKRIQGEFRQIGLIVDKPKQGGGNSNDGNTARRFFANPSVSSQITGVKQSVIERCAVILKTLASCFAINAEIFQEYTQETAREIVAEYPWYPLPASVHKVLIHGGQIVKHSILPIGQFTEEAAEAKNKDVKFFRSKNTRKTSRTSTNTDLLNRLLLTSDPLLSNERNFKKNQKSTLSKEILNLLL